MFGLGFDFDFDKVIAEMREAVSVLKERMDALEQRVSQVEGELAEAVACAKKAADNSETIIELMAHAKGFAGLLAKHGPRFFAAGIGMAIYAGLIDGELGAMISAAFGI